MSLSVKFRHNLKSDGLIRSTRMLTADLVRMYFPRSLGMLLWIWKATRPQAYRECSCCGYKGFFAVFGVPLRGDAQCPSCSSLERHRLFYLGFNRGEMFGDNLAFTEPILHFAPEEIIEKLLRRHCQDYQTADLFELADLQLNLEKIELQDEFAGTVVANHVLEHVDDVRALSELFRILKSGGSLVVSVPIVEGWDATYENCTVNSDRERSLHFGQKDHLRFYGKDFRDRVVAAGFSLNHEITASGEDVVRYGLVRGEKIFVFRK